jgi:hypothetical protein
MATGILGKADILADTDTDIYEVPANAFAVASINICNRGVATVKVSIALRDPEELSVAAQDYIEYEVEVLPSGAFERTGIVLQAGATIVVRSDTSAVTALVHGLETATN